MSEVAGTLGNDSRLILMLLITAGEKSVETLCDLSGIPVASTSQHLQVLKKANMVVTRREGKRVLYRLQNGPIRELIDALERFAVFRGLKSDDSGVGAGEGIAPRQLEKKLKSGKTLLVDVRSREEFNKAHITGAVSIPFEELKKQTARLPKDREIVVYCRGPYCVLSLNALSLLRSKGIEALRLTSGFSDWHGARTESAGTSEKQAIRKP
ncbi:MAG: metalloregulator ArsR/SmtB family transcription factor [Turneriella sp.]